MMKRLLPITLWLVALIAIAIALLEVESDLLWKVQQYNLFLSSSLFFKQQMVVSGGLLSYLGTFFTQFFYHPWVGVVLLCGWWLLLMWLVKRTFCIPDKWSIVTLIPVAILLTANMDLGYWIYAMKLPGYFFSATIGTTIAVALLWAFRKLPANIWVRIVYIVFILLACYPLMGVYALVTTLLMAIWTWRLSNNRQQNIILSAATLLAIIAVPLIYYRFVYYQTNIVEIYCTALPDFSFFEKYPNYHIPYYLLALCFLIFAIAYRHPKPEMAEKKTESKNNKNKKKKTDWKPILHWTEQGVILVVLVIGVKHFWYKDDNFHHELRMERCIENCDWEGVLEEGKKQNSEPTRAIVMMHNLALSRLGRQCDEMYNFRKGSSRSKTSLPIYMHNTAGRLIYYQYGVTNEVHRMCMENGVDWGWSVELLQYMARAAILDNEPQVARKFLNLLRQTYYYGDWADHMEKLLNNPDLLARDRETGPITHMMQYPDIQSEGDGYVEKNLMIMLSKTDSDDPYFQEQAVLAAMWTRNSSDFWPRFDQYLGLNPGKPIPRIMQEAAYFFGMLEEQPFIDQLPIDQSVKDSFKAFMTPMEECQGKPSAQLRNWLFQNYGNTYYFEFFFLRNITYF